MTGPRALPKVPRMLAKTGSGLLRRLALGLLPLTAVGCGEPGPDLGAEPVARARTALDPAYPVVDFRDDWTVGLSAPLVGGQPAVLRYALSRQARCRGDAWRVLASIAAPGHTTTVVELPGTERTGALERHFTVPAEADVSIWFEGRDGSGCQAWDTDFGRNFRFAPQLPARTVHLRSDFTTRVDGTLTAGAPFSVDFDLQRLPFCVSRTAAGRWQGTATMSYRFDGGAVTEVSLLALPAGVPADVDGEAGALAIAPTVTPPAGARAVELWFHAADRYGCTLWDSNYGSNYRFELAP